MFDRFLTNLFMALGGMFFVNAVCSIVLTITRHPYPAWAQAASCVVGIAIGYILRVKKVKHNER